MVVDGDGEEFLCAVLTDDILVEILLDGLGFLEFAHLDSGSLLLMLVLQLGDVVGCHLGAVGADVAVDAAEQQRDFVLAAAAEAAVTALAAILFRTGHAYFFLRVRISSTMPYSLASWAVIQKSRSASAKTLS